MTDESLVTGSEEINEVKTEDVLYSEDQQTDETVEEVSEKTSEDETQKEVDESLENKELQETEESPGDEKETLEYKLEVEEGSLFDADMVKEFEAIAKENSLSKEAASNLLKTQENLMKSWIEGKMQAHEDEVSQWRKQVIDDREFGGQNLNKTVANARKTVDRFASPEFIEMLRETGYGDHPEVVKMFSKIGSLLSEDKLVMGNDFSTTRSAEELFYGSN